jgi:hypothetical protein
MAANKKIERIDKQNKHLKVLLVKKNIYMPIQTSTSSPVN